jgi:hypothetical protein
MLQECIDSFGLAVYMPLGYPSYGSGGQIIYEDDSTADILCYGGDTEWKTINLKAQLEPAKGKVKGIRLTCVGSPSIWMDAVSLIGTCV